MLSSSSSSSFSSQSSRSLLNTQDKNLLGTNQTPSSGKDGREVGIMSPTEIYHREQNHSLRTLVVLCRGLMDKDGKNQILDIKEHPWTTLAASLIRPNAIEYSKEIERRWELVLDPKSSTASAMKAPRPKAWKLEKILEWLDSHPITGKADVEYLQRIVRERKKVVEDAEIQRQASTTNDNHDTNKNWTGTHAYLRLIHCLVDNDEIKRAYLHRYDNPPGRLHIDNRNSIEKRNKSVWELISDKFNDPTFTPVTEALPTLHSDFTCSEEIGHDLVKHFSRATPEKCQSKFASMILQMNRGIARWERSGQGEGGIITFDNEVDQEETPGEEEEHDSFFTGIEESGDAATAPQYGILTNRSQIALDSRHCFFAYHQSYLLYMWEMLSRHDLLRSSFQKLDEAVASSNGARGVPSLILADHHPAGGAECASSSGSRGKQQVAEDIQSLSTSITTLANNAITVATMHVGEQQKNRVHEAICKLRDSIERGKSEKRKLSTQLVIEMSRGKKNKAMTDLLTEQIKELDDDKMKQEEEIKKLLQD